MRVITLLGIMALLVATRAAAIPPLCGPADDPCVVTQDLSVAGGSSFDLGTRALVVGTGHTITVRDDGELAVRAKTITLEAGAKILAIGPPGTEAEGGRIELTVDGDVELGVGSVLDVSNWYAGVIDIRARGAVRALGLIRGVSTSRDGYGAYVAIETLDADAAGDVRIAGTGVQVSGGNRYGGHGMLSVAAGGDIDILAPVISRGGEGGGEGVDLVANGNITTGPAADIDVTELDAGGGSFIYMTADGTITTDGRLLATGSGTGGGYGGQVDLYGFQGLTVRGAVDATGASEYGAPGLLGFGADTGDVVIDAVVTARGHPEWDWSEVTIGTSGDLLVRGTIDISGAYGYANVYAEVQGRIRIEGRIIATGANEPGSVSLNGCDVELPAGSLLDVRGPHDGAYDYSNIQAGGLVTIGGTLRFSRPLEVAYRDTPPVVLPGAVITPSLAPALHPEIPCCHCAPVCGDARRDDGEACDDGNVLDGDCCSSTCQAEPAGGACDDASTCTTNDVCLGNGTCAGVPLACDVCERCDEGVGCVVGPKPACRRIVVPGRGQVDLKDRTPDTGDSVLWQWRGGVTTPLPTFGDPIGTDDYALCIWDAPSSLLLRADAPHGGACGSKPCWKALGNRGFGYRNASGAPDGLFKMKLLAGTAGKPVIQVNGRGAALPMSSLGSVALPLTVQLQASNGACWESTHSIASVNVPAQLKAKSD
ncbi:MAG TPA: hypothetical protein VGR62_26240 [Candidatus Binatia bacterium]|jgi:cysteine-rich repeat protein|nr:hypothetical protein [Candidatus Binatia bacterium]